MRNLYIIGDPHGLFTQLRYMLMNYKDSDFILAGDINLGFPDLPKFQHLTDAYSEFEGWNEELKADGNVVYCMRGNHDNPAVWFNKELNYSNIRLVQDYEVLELKKNVLCVGGATSVDRYDRKENTNWWKDEVLVYDEEKILSMENIEIVVTHSAPLFVFPRGLDNDFLAVKYEFDKELRADLMYERSQLDVMFNILMEKNNIKHFLYGHFHKSKTEYHRDVKFQLLDEMEITEIE